MKAFLLLVSIISSMNSAVCDFVEKSKLGGEVYTEKGIFYFEKGKGLRWDYHSPERKTFWLLGEKIIEIYPEENLIREYKSPRSFWKIIEDPSELYQIAEKIVEKKGEIFVKIKGGEEVVIHIREHRIQRVDFEDTSFEFQKCRYNIKQPSSLWKVPATFVYGSRKK